MSVRALLVATVALCAFGAIPLEGGGSLVDPSVALAEGEMRVGDRLVAVTDVELDAAIIRAGSHVSVVGRKAKAGRVVFDVALADGHVVKAVPLSRLRASFRVA